MLKTRNIPSGLYHGPVTFWIFVFIDWMINSQRLEKTIKSWCKDRVYKKNHQEHFLHRFKNNQKQGIADVSVNKRLSLTLLPACWTLFLLLGCLSQPWCNQPGLIVAVPGNLALFWGEVELESTWGRLELEGERLRKRREEKLQSGSSRWKTNKR